MRKSLVVLFAVAGVGFCPTSIALADVSGTITINTIWDLAGSPYILVGDLTVRWRSL